MFIEKLKAAKRINSRYQLFQILELSKLYCRDDFKSAVNISLQYNVFNSSFIAGYLEKNHKQKFDLKFYDQNNQLRKMTTVNIKRDMNEYCLFDKFNEDIN